MTDTQTARPIFGPGAQYNLIHVMLRAAGFNPSVRGLPSITEDEARTILATARGEQRTNPANLTLSTTAGGADVKLTPSAHFNEHFVDSALTEFVVAPLFTRNDLPAYTGETLRIPKVTTSATVATQSGGDANTVPTQGSPVTAAVDIPVAEVSGLILASWQFLDLALQPGGEEIVARILGKRHAEAVDHQLWTGAGSSGDTIGLVNTSSPTAVSYTDASPTVPEFLTALHKLRSQAHTARRAKLDTVVMHPRRSSWYYEGAASTLVDFSSIERAGLNVVEYAGVTTTNGSEGPPGTEDEVLMCRSSDLEYWATDPELIVAEDFSGMDTGQVAIVIRGYVASPAGNLNPGGIGLLTGTGLVGPSGY